MSTFYTSDLHVGHRNIIDFCSRPYKHVDDMNRAIVERINSTVSPDDTLWILGDLAMGDIDVTLPIIKRILAKKKIVLGNHDRAHPYYGAKSERWVERYEQETGAEIVYRTNTDTILKDGTKVLVSHFPYGDKDKRPVLNRSGKTITEDKFASYRVVDDGSWLLCGHAHEKWAVQGKQINVGLDAWGGFPVHEDTIIDIIQLGISDKAGLAWK